LTEFEVKKILRKNGWVITEGKKHSMAKNELSFPGIKIPIPRHKGDLNPDTVDSILRSAKLK